MRVQSSNMRTNELVETACYEGCPDLLAEQHGVEGGHEHYRRADGQAVTKDDFGYFMIADWRPGTLLTQPV